MRFLTDYEAVCFLQSKGWKEVDGLLYSPTDRCEEWGKDEYEAFAYLAIEWDYAWGGVNAKVS